LAMAAATQPPAVSASAPPGSAPRYGDPTTMTPTATPPPTIAGRHRRGPNVCATAAETSRMPTMNAPRAAGAMAAYRLASGGEEPGVPVAGRGRVADRAVELQARPGEHVEADDRGDDRRGRPHRPERAAPPRPERDRGGDHGGEAGADQGEPEPRRARPPPGD